MAADESTLAKINIECMGSGAVGCSDWLGDVCKKRRGSASRFLLAVNGQGRCVKPIDDLSNPFWRQIHFCQEGFYPLCVVRMCSTLELVKKTSFEESLIHRHGAVRGVFGCGHIV